MATNYATNALIKARREALESEIQSHDNLAIKANLSAEEQGLLKDLPTRITDARKALDDALKADEAVAAAKGLFHPGADGGVLPMSAAGVDAMKALSQLDDVQKKIIGAKMGWGEKVGHETYGWSVDKFGNPTKAMPIEGDGWAITDEGMMAIMEPSYLKAFNGYIRRGPERTSKADMQLLNDTKSTVLGAYKALSEGSDDGGGYFVPPQFMAQLIQRKPHPTKILSYVQTVPCSADQVVWPRINDDASTDDIYVANDPRIQWIGEKGPTPSQPDPVFGNVTISVYTGQFYIEVSRNLLEDSHISISQIIGMLGGQAYDLGLDNVIVNGQGVYQPTGITTNAGAAGVYCPVVNCGNPISVPGLINLVEGMPPQYSDSETTVALMNKINAWATFAQLEDSSGQLIFGLARTQGPEGLASPRVHNLLGYPVIFSAFWPNVGAGNYPLGFGDLKQAYIFCQRVGITIETYGTQDRSMIQKNQLGWNFRFRCGGQVVQNRAFHVGQQS